MPQCIDSACVHGKTVTERCKKLFKKFLKRHKSVNHSYKSYSCEIIVPYNQQFQDSLIGLN